MANDPENDGLEAMSKGEVLQRFGCAAGPHAECGNYESCALTKAWAEGFIVEEEPAADAPDIRGNTTG